jgi:hypothetical protein
MTDAKKPAKYFIRFSQAEDFDKISEFYDLNAHKNVRKREHDLIKHLAEDGAVILVEDEKGRIVASSITYAHKGLDDKGVEHVMWQELGTTRCVLNGYTGIFDAMIAMQALRAFLVEPPENMFVSQMHTSAVQGLAGKLGWRRAAEVPPGLMEAKKSTVAPEDLGAVSTNNWFVFGMEGMPVAAKWLENAVENPVLTNKKTGEQIELDFSKSTFFTMFKDEIKNLAARDFGDVEKPDQKQSMRQRRDLWLKKHFR